MTTWEIIGFVGVLIIAGQFLWWMHRSDKRWDDSHKNS